MWKGFNLACLFKAQREKHQWLVRHDRKRSRMDIVIKGFCPRAAWRFMAE